MVTAEELRREQAVLEENIKYIEAELAMRTLFGYYTLNLPTSKISSATLKLYEEAGFAVATENIEWGSPASIDFSEPKESRNTRVLSAGVRKQAADMARYSEFIQISRLLDRALLDGQESIEIKLLPEQQAYLEGLGYEYDGKELTW